MCHICFLYRQTRWGRQCWLVQAGCPCGGLNKPIETDKQTSKNPLAGGVAVLDFMLQPGGSNMAGKLKETRKASKRAAAPVAAAPAAGDVTVYGQIDRR